MSNGKDLVEPEGVNAGSDRSTVEGDREPARPQVAADVGDSGPRPAIPDDRSEALLAPAADGVESGQDSGSMS